MKKTSFTLFATLILVGCVIISSNATAEKLNTLEDGQAAFNAGNYTLAFSLWSTLATQGNSEAQVFVGLSYDNGWGTNRSAHLARVWFQKAAIRENTSGQYLLGLHYIQGSNAERAIGMLWLKRAADNGDIAAQQFIQKGEKRGWFKGIPSLAVPIKKKEQSAPQTVALVQ